MRGSDGNFESRAKHILSEYGVEIEENFRI